jgi:hypothetical protein
MRFFIARRLALAAFLPVLFSFTLIPGCSEQSEGDRCGDDIGRSDDSDCNAGLVCTTIDATAHIYRCCNPTRTTNARCVKVTATVAGGAGGDAGASGNAGASTSGGEANVSGGGSSAGTSGEAGVAGDPSPPTESGAGGA